MSLPEISRRCVACGAAVRANARFCQQCGKSVPEGSAHADAVVSAPAEEPTPTTRDVEVPQASASSTREVYAAAAPESEPSPVRAAEVSTPLEVSQPSEVSQPLSVPEMGERRAVSNVDAVEAAEAFAPSALPLQSPAPSQTTPEDGASAEERRGRVARVREEARVRVENTRARVERVRDDALVALEETPDDSGLRFVLVTVFLFALFLLFLFLSVTVLR